MRRALLLCVEHCYWAPTIVCGCCSVRPSEEHEGVEIRRREWQRAGPFACPPQLQWSSKRTAHRGGSSLSEGGSLKRLSSGLDKQGTRYSSRGDPMGLFSPHKSAAVKNLLAVKVEVGDPEAARGSRLQRLRGPGQGSSSGRGAAVAAGGAAAPVRAMERSAPTPDASGAVQQSSGTAANNHWRKSVGPLTGLTGTGASSSSSSRGGTNARAGAGGSKRRQRSAGGMTMANAAHGDAHRCSQALTATALVLALLYVAHTVRHSARARLLFRYHLSLLN